MLKKMRAQEFYEGGNCVDVFQVEQIDFRRSSKILQREGERERPISQNILLPRPHSGKKTGQKALKR